MRSGFDVVALRAGFPSLASGIAHFDGPGGTQTPAVVAEAMARTLTGPLSNRGGLVASERNADAAVADFRSTYATFLGADPRGIVYGRSATQLTYDFARHLSRTWRPGDQVVVTRLDHDANVRPWVQAAQAAGATVRWLDLDPASAELDPIDTVLSERTRLVAVTAASNLLGTKPDVRAIADAAHRVGALVYVDGVHHAPHAEVDLTALGADFFVCSPYKFLGPHCAVLAAAPELLESITPDKLLPSTDAVPERFEFGTLPYEIMAGATAAAEFVMTLTIAAVEAHEERLRARLEDGLAGFGDDVVLWSRAAARTPTLLITMPGRDVAAASRHLAEHGVLAPSGSFYAWEASRRLGIDDTGLRMGLAPYSDDSDVERLLAGLADFLTRTPRRPPARP